MSHDTTSSSTNDTGSDGATSNGTSYKAADRGLDLGRPKGSRTGLDLLMRGLVWAAAVVAILPLLWILFTVVSRGAPLLFTTQPEYTRICAVSGPAPDAQHMDFKRVSSSACGAGQEGAKWTWLPGGHYPAVNQFVQYSPVAPSTQNPNESGLVINVQGQEKSAAVKKVIGYPTSDDGGVIRIPSAGWWTQDQSKVDLMNIGGGAIHSIVGTLWIGLITSAIAVPLGALGAIYLVEYARGTKLAKVVSFMVDILTGVPSIVAALFVYTVVITMFGGGRSTLASALALVLLMLPTVLRSTEEMLKLVPDSLREASYALGVPKWKTILSVVVPTARTGIATGIVLGMARVMGETAPLLILLNYGPKLTLNPLTNNMGSLPLQITGAADVAATYPGAERGWGAAFTLILLVMGLNLIAKYAGRSKKSR